ncbi:hypothetical protein B0H14DRAFT_2631864 [Mycena olivaceomarginata]|nr:hypothetical protein B0H14DRAFT_2631864 [Mycena olivaceomarginata]
MTRPSSTSSKEIFSAVQLSRGVLNLIPGRSNFNLASILDFCSSMSVEGTCFLEVDLQGIARSSWSKITGAIGNEEYDIREIFFYVSSVAMSGTHAWQANAEIILPLSKMGIYSTWDVAAKSWTLDTLSPAQIRLRKAFDQAFLPNNGTAGETCPFYPSRVGRLVNSTPGASETWARAAWPSASKPRVACECIGRCQVWLALRVSDIEPSNMRVFATFGAVGGGRQHTYTRAPHLSELSKPSA